MGFIKNALIGVALYEAVKYLIKKDEVNWAFSGNGLPYRRDRIFEVGTDPGAPLAGQNTVAPQDPWKDALADETLRAPDA